MNKLELKHIQEQKQVQKLSWEKEVRRVVEKMKFRECTIGDHGHCIKETKTEGKCVCICHDLYGPIWNAELTKRHVSEGGLTEIDMERDDTDCKW